MFTGRTSRLAIDCFIFAVLFLRFYLSAIPQISGADTITLIIGKTNKQTHEQIHPRQI